MCKDRAIGLKQQLGFPNGVVVGAQGLGVAWLCSGDGMFWWISKICQNLILMLY